MSVGNGVFTRGPRVHAALRSGDRARSSALRRPSGTVFGEFARVARRSPDADAVIATAGSITYGQLASIASRLGADLQRDHAPTDGSAPTPFALAADGSVATVVAMMAVFASGHPLVALDAHLPAARQDTLVRTSGAVLVDTAAISWSDADVDIVEPDVAVATHATAVICFTSGSTGDPKGVVLDHAGCLDKVHDVIEGVALTAEDVVGNVLPISFGAGMTTLLAGLLAGAGVVLGDPRDGASIGEWLRNNRVTTVHSSVSFLRTVTSGAAVVGLHPSVTVDTVRAVITYGEPAHASDVTRCRAAFAPNATYINWFAITECGVVAYSAVRPHDPLPDGFLPAGRPVPGRVLEIVDEDGRPQPVDTLGEVVVVGGRPAVGYLNLDSDRFGSDDRGVSRYRTGDLGRLDDRGTLRLAGRADDAVKIRGYLVEPAEVAGVLLSMHAVADVHVGSIIVDGHTELVAYLVTDDSFHDVRAVSAVRAFAAERLPQWMIPRFIVPLAALPRTARGKVDRGRLPDPAATPNRGEPAKTSSSLTMIAVGDIVATVLDGPLVGPDDDLIAAGADSLSFVSMATLVRERFHAELDLVRFLEAPTMTTLATLIDEATRAGVTSRPGTTELVPLRTEGAGEPLFVVTGAGAPAVSLLPLVRHLDPERPVYGLQARGLDSRARPDRTVGAAADRYIAHIRSVQPHGPYLLAGHSMGGIVALEMASRLRDLGEETREVVVIDSRLTNELIAGIDGDGTADAHDGALSSADAYETLRLSLPALIRIRLQMMVAGYITFAPITQWMLFYNKGLRALRKHTPRPYPGAVTVLRTAENPQDESVWSRVATGPLCIRDVPGSHTDLLREPYVIGVAEQTEQALAVAPGTTGRCATR